MKEARKEKRFNMNNYGPDGAIVHDYYAFHKFMREDMWKTLLLSTD